MAYIFEELSKILALSVIASTPRIIVQRKYEIQTKPETEIKLMLIEERNDLIRKVKAENKRLRKAAKKQALFVKPNTNTNPT